MTIEIVAFQPQHIEEVLTILHESNCLHYQNNPDYFASRDKSVSRPYLEWILKDPNTFGFVALSQQVVAGIVVAGLETRIDNIYQADKYYKIYDIAVGSKFKKMGIGRKLHEAVVQKARCNDIRQIELEVYSFNSGAKVFYKKLHYEEVCSTMVLNTKLN